MTSDIYLQMGEALIEAAYRVISQLGPIYFPGLQLTDRGSVHKLYHPGDYAIIRRVRRTCCPKSTIIISPGELAYDKWMREDEDGFHTLKFTQLCESWKFSSEISYCPYKKQIIFIIYTKTS